MRIWTISALDGTTGDRVAAELAAAAGVPLYDRAAFAELAGRLGLEIPEPENVEERFCGRSALALRLANPTGAAEPILELKLRRALPELARVLISEAAHSSCVIASPAAFAALADHPSAVHARIRAPFEWRVETFRREQLLDRPKAEKALRHADRIHRAWVRLLSGCDPEDESLYTICLDASRLGSDRMIETLLAAGGVPAAVAA